MTENLGKLFVWGAGHTGIAGSGPAEDSPVPLPVPGMPEVTFITAGDSTAYAIDADGSVLSWGWDAFHHLLGRGVVEYPPPLLPLSLRKMDHKAAGRMPGDGGVAEPRYIDDLSSIIQIAAAGENVYALTSQGQVMAWGGAPGLGRKAGKKAARPEQLTGLPFIVGLASSQKSMFCAALDENGRVWSWGNGWEGELGHGKPRCQPEPQVVPMIDNIKSLHAGDFSAWALRQDGTVWFWGNGQYLDLAVRKSYRLREPVRIPELNDIASLFTGPHSCIARTVSGMTFALGTIGERIPGLEAQGKRVVRVDAFDAFEHFSLGSDHGLAWNVNGPLYSFGDSAHGALGNGTAVEQEYHSPAPVPGMNMVTTAKAGNSFSLAVIR
jgi:alpha-tubulin suppressor-like RCC1 family protein